MIDHVETILDEPGNQFLLCSPRRPPIVGFDHENSHLWYQPGRVERFQYRKFRPFAVQLDDDLLPRPNFSDDIAQNPRCVAQHDIRTSITSCSPYRSVKGTVRIVRDRQPLIFNTETNIMRLDFCCESRVEGKVFERPVKWHRERLEPMNNFNCWHSSEMQRGQADVHSDIEHTYVSRDVEIIGVVFQNLADNLKIFSVADIEPYAKSVYDNAVGGGDDSTAVVA